MMIVIDSIPDNARDVHEGIGRVVIHVTTYQKWDRTLLSSGSYSIGVVESVTQDMQRLPMQQTVQVGSVVTSERVQR